MVKLRFKRIGKKNRPYYRLCAIESRNPRGGEYLESLGFYDPLIRDDTQKFRVNKERAEYWLSVGAQPSDVVRSFLRKHDIKGLVRARKPSHKRPKRAAPAAPAAAAALAGAAVPGAAPVSTKKAKPPKKQKPPKQNVAEAGGAAPPVAQ